ncbi:hypothetical protein [Roseovarius amoyensis]|uniref:hypothetical protein n=1 Tax=Roseovarius amoyensis TaxID=2211448 RepID=UPI000DBE229E|nr:hypothetical protein [Roseovarius amoyensis]
MNTRPGDIPHDKPRWWLTKDGDRTLLALYERHYSAYQYQDGRVRRLFAGPGEKIVLRTRTGDAGFVWRNFISDDDQCGINCAFFRNEGPHLSSELIRQADRIADKIWSCRRHYTYVDAQKVRSANPGYCFIMAGWRRCGETKSGKLIFERCTRK